jgi:hypothetical protein
LYSKVQKKYPVERKNLNYFISVLLSVSSFIVTFWVSEAAQKIAW